MGRRADRVARDSGCVDGPLDRLGDQPGHRMDRDQRRADLAARVRGGSVPCATRAAALALDARGGADRLRHDQHLRAADEGAARHAGRGGDLRAAARAVRLLERGRADCGARDPDRRLAGRAPGRPCSARRARLPRARPARRRDAAGVLARRDRRVRDRSRVLVLVHPAEAEGRGGSDPIGPARRAGQCLGVRAVGPQRRRGRADAALERRNRARRPVCSRSCSSCSWPA